MPKRDPSTKNFRSDANDWRAGLDGLGPSDEICWTVAKEIQTEVAVLAAQYAVSAECFKHQVAWDPMGKRLVAKLSQLVHKGTNPRRERFTFEWEEPATWWDHFKRDVIPVEWRIRLGVRYKMKNKSAVLEHVVEERFCPHLPITGDGRTMRHLMWINREE